MLRSAFWAVTAILITGLAAVPVVNACTAFLASGEGGVLFGNNQDLAVNLNRIEVLAPLPPSTDPAVLQDRERIRITVFWADREQSQELVVEAGYLDLERLGAGAQAVERTADGAPPVGLWFPATGKLLQIPVQLVVTARSMVPSPPKAMTTST